MLGFGCLDFALFLVSVLQLDFEFDQATRDLITAATMAFVLGTEHEKEGAKASWADLASAFWKTSGQMKDEETPRARKLHRTKVFQWLCAANHMLQVSTGRGFNGWRLHPQASQPLKWPSLTICADQGSDGYSAVHFLLSKHFNVLPVWDQSHRIWNDTQLGLHDSGLMYYVMATVIVLNADGGPFSTSRWYQSIREAAAEYMRVACSADPIFSGLVNLIREDKFGSDLGASNDVSDDELFQSLAGDFKTKTKKVSMSRWFGFLDSTEDFLPRWSSRLVISLYLCLQMGLFKNKHSGEILDAIKTAKVKNPEDDIDKATTKNDREEIQRLRKSCANTMSFQCKMLGDSQLRLLNYAIHDVIAPVKEFHGLQNVRNRSGHESLKWWSEMAAGGWKKHVNGVLRKLNCRELFTKLGLLKTNVERSVRGMKVEDPLVEADDDFTGKICCLVISVVGRRMRSCADYVGMPYCFPGLVDEEASPKIFQRLKATKEDWDFITSEDGEANYNCVWWKKVKRRSNMHWMKVKQVLALAEQATL